MAALNENGLTTEVRDWTAVHSPTVWIAKTQVRTELSDHEFFGWIASIVDPCGGSVIIAGHPSHPLEPIWKLTPAGRAATEKGGQP